MNIPSKFKETIESIFYDKELKYYSKVSKEDDEGGQIEEIYKQLIPAFKGNAQISDNTLLKEKYGFKKESDYVFTFNDVKVEIGNYIKFNEKYYQLLEVKTFDSHNMVTGKVIENG